MWRSSIGSQRKKKLFSPSRMGFKRLCITSVMAMLASLHRKRQFKLASQQNGKGRSQRESRDHRKNQALRRMAMPQASRRETSPPRTTTATRKVLVQVEATQRLQRRRPSRKATTHVGISANMTARRTTKRRMCSSLSPPLSRQSLSSPRSVDCVHSFTLFPCTYEVGSLYRWRIGIRYALFCMRHCPKPNTIYRTAYTINTFGSVDEHFLNIETIISITTFLQWFDLVAKYDCACQEWNAVKHSLT